MNGAISVQNLCKTYGEQRAVDDISFDVGWNKVTGFLGPNGAGKTTTLRMVLGLAAPSSGSAFVLNQPYGALADPVGSVGALLETQQFHPQRTARNHLRALAAASDLPSRRADEVLDEVDLTKAASKKVGEFSLGMRQRLGLAAALLGAPRLLVLDEPANGLDPAGIKWLRSFVRSYATGDRAVFLSSHLLGEITQMADDLVVIDRGRLVAQAPVEGLLHRAQRGVRVRAESPEKLRDALGDLGAEIEPLAHDTLRVRGMQVEDVGRAAAASGLVLFGLEVEEVDLEDVFFELTSTGEMR